jgi:hypothetical protein
MTTATTQEKPSTTTKARQAAGELGDNPLALVAGGMALGVLVGALLPRLERERALLDPLGRSLAERASSAAQAAKDAGRQEIDALLPGRDDAREKVSALFGTVIDAARGISKA